MSKCILLDATNGTCREVEISSDDDVAVVDIRRHLQADGFELATHWTNGDVLYVDRDWLRRPRRRFFVSVNGCIPHPTGSNGLIVGPERSGSGSHDAKMTVEKATASFRWLDRNEANRFMAAIANQPGATINGELVMTMAQYWAELGPERTGESA